MKKWCSLSEAKNYVLQLRLDRAMAKIKIEETVINPGDKVYHKNLEMTFVRVFSINGKELPNILLCSWPNNETNKTEEDLFNICDLTIKPV